MSSADAFKPESSSTAAPAEKFIVFEQPLNERMRTFLRLEFLFDKLMHFLNGASEWDSRVSLDTLLDILNLLGRVEIKAELIREMERQINTLERIPDNPDVDGSLCVQLVRQLQGCLQRLRKMDSIEGTDLKRNDFIRAISQRAGMPGGTSAIDLPNLHFWLQQEARQRIDFLSGLYAVVAPIKDALDMVLSLIRKSSGATEEIAVSGNFSRNLDPEIAYQLVRILLSPEQRCVAEMSTGKYRASVRFLEPSELERPRAVNRDVPFHLVCCRL